MKILELELPSDYGCLALLDIEKYSGFVSEDWELEQLKDHICHENSRGNIFAWGCASCNWKLKLIYVRLSSLVIDRVSHN